MESAFPRTVVGGKSLSRMLIGTNWILGYSHTSSSADRLITTLNESPETIAEIFKTYLRFGVDSVMGPFAGNEKLIKAVRLAEDAAGKKMVIIDTPSPNMDDSAQARRDAEATIKLSRASGADFCLIHHSCCEQLVNRNRQTIDRLPDYLSMIREQGMLPGLSAHMPEIIVYSDKNEYDVETYIQIYNCMGFLMQVEVEYIHKVIHDAKKPVMTIKSMAAGRCSPFVGITFAFATIRDCDMVTIGAMTPDEALEDIEIALAALERRRPDIEGRASVNKTSIMK